MVTVLGAGGGALAGRKVRFDVLAGPYGITSPSSAGQTVVTTLTVTSDADGKASVLIKANVDAPTQYAQLRVTDLTSGQQLVGNFLIQQVTTAPTIITVVPARPRSTESSTASARPAPGSITSSTAARRPYHVSSTFPNAVTIVNQPRVNASGGFFEAITNGTCVNPLTFTIDDATGRQTTATLVNAQGANRCRSCR